MKLTGYNNHKDGRSREKITDIKDKSKENNEIIEIQINIGS